MNTPIYQIQELVGCALVVSLVEEHNFHPGIALVSIERTAPDPDIQSRYRNGDLVMIEAFDLDQKVFENEESKMYLIDACNIVARMVS